MRSCLPLSQFLTSGPLCWIHAERSINKLVGSNDAQREALAKIRTQIWEFYAELKSYKQSPGPEKKAELQERFDQIFTTHTCYETLNQALKRIHKNKSELLLVLERPDVPLHNNTSETDIREYVKKRKISGSTRSDLGRRCRDAFASLKKTCRKLGNGFWRCLEDRVSRKNSIPSLPHLMRLRVRETLVLQTPRADWSRTLPPTDLTHHLAEGTSGTQSLTIVGISPELLSSYSICSK